MTIRKYRASDKGRLGYICRETAGEDYKKSAKKLDTVPIIYNNYYTEFEPENIFVLADDSDIAVGYIICSTDTKKYIKCNLDIYSKNVLKKYPTSLYFLFGTLLLMKTVKAPPVHFHIDILPQYQHGGWGTALMNALCAELKLKGVKRLYAFGIDRESIGFMFYKKYGFDVCRDYGFGMVTIVKNL